MGNTKVKTTYEIETEYGEVKEQGLFCTHYHNINTTVFYEEDGSIASMVFNTHPDDTNLWYAMQKLYQPFVQGWGGELKEGVEFYTKGPWET